MIKHVPLKNWASKDLHALLSCNIGFGHLSRQPDISTVGLMLRGWVVSWCRVRHKCPECAGNELDAALRHDDAVTGFLTILQSA